MRVLVRYYRDHGRMGDVEGLFVVSQEDFEKITKLPSFYLGDYLGKHSEVEVDPSHCTVLVSETPEIKQAFDVMETYVCTGVADHILDRLNNPEDFYDEGEL